MASLFVHSVEMMTRAQAPSGAIVACPDFPTYQYSWLRDGSFTAYALDRAGRHDAAARFYAWVDTAVQGVRQRVEAALAAAGAGVAANPRDLLHCRFTLTGDEGSDEWGNFQLDGWGAFLWALAEHRRLAGGLRAELPDSARFVARYLATCWHMACFDCWEEHGDRVHPATLACLYGGLTAIAPHLPEAEAGAARCTALAIRQRVLVEGVHAGRLTKWLGGSGIDASLLWCVVPFDMVPPEAPVMRATVAAIESACVGPGGGVHRYPDDTYYGGGAWLLLTAWLGWYYCRVGNRRRAQELREWLERQATADGALPEQVAVDLYDPAAYAGWVARWGAPACPLVWSHAMYVVLYTELEQSP